MKRLVWLVLFAFGTALAQVSPVELPVTKHEICGCCEQPGACGMPDCLPLPVSAQPVFNLAGPARTLRLAAQASLPAPRADREMFFEKFLPRAHVAPVLPVTLVLAPPAGVPLFREHCSLLI
jgi:hypothetical protein